MYNHFYCHSQIEIKSDSPDTELRRIQGYFSTSDIDRGDDIVKPEAFIGAVETFMKNPILCFNHNWNEGIGRIIDVKVDNKGCWVTAEIARGTQTAEEVWTLIKQGVYNAFSFAFRILESKEEITDERTIRVITKLDLLEVSVVTIPANANAVFSVIKGLNWGVDIYPQFDTVKNIAQEKEEVPDTPITDKKDLPPIEYLVKVAEILNTLNIQNIEHLVKTAEILNTLNPQSDATMSVNDDTEEKGATSFSDFPLLPITTIWSKTKARDEMAKYASKDGSGNKDTIDWKKYAKGFFWFDSSDPENFGSYKMPFCYVKDGELYAVPRGIFASAAVINGARGGVSIPEGDVEKVKSHIRKYYKKMEMEDPFKGSILLVFREDCKSGLKNLIEKNSFAEILVNEFIERNGFEIDDSDIDVIKSVLENLLDQ